MLNKFDRVLIDEDYKHMERHISKGTIGTIRDFIGNDLAIVQYDYDQTTKEIICAGIPTVILQKASAEELEGIADVNCLVPKMYQIGNYFLFNETEEKFIGNTGKISDIKLFQNEYDDQIVFTFGDEHVIYNKSKADAICSFLGFEGSQSNLSELEQVPSYCNCSDSIQLADCTESAKSGIPIIINGQKFIVNNDNQTISCSFNKSDLIQVTKAISVLNDLINN